MNRTLVLGVLALSVLSCRTIGELTPTPAPMGGVATPAPRNPTSPSFMQAAVPSADVQRASERICRVETGYGEGYVNIRSGPSMDSPVVAVASQGDQLLVLPGDSFAGWVEIVTAGGLRGFFYAPFWCDFSEVQP